MLIRLTINNIDNLLSRWKNIPDSRNDSFVFRESILSSEDVRTKCWDAGILVKIKSKESDIYLVEFDDLVSESTN